MDAVERLRTSLILHLQCIMFSPERSSEITDQINVFNKSMNERDGSHDYYTTNRAASKPSKDNFIGKIGEFVLAEFLVNNFGFPKDVVPDLTVYTSRKKSWSPDLDYNSKYKEYPSLHCKTCDSQTATLMQRYRGKERCSWMFQNGNRNDGYGRDYLLKNTQCKEVVGLVYVTSTNPIIGRVVFTTPWYLISDLLEDPVISKYKELKRCIYSLPVLQRYKELKCLQN